MYGRCFLADIALHGKAVKGNSLLSTSLRRLCLNWFHAFIGTIRPSDCLQCSCLPPFVVRIPYPTPDTDIAGSPTSCRDSVVQHEQVSDTATVRDANHIAFPHAAFHVVNRVGQWNFRGFGAQYCPYCPTSHALHPSLLPSAQGSLPAVRLHFAGRDFHPLAITTFLGALTVHGKKIDKSSTRIGPSTHQQHFFIVYENNSSTVSFPLPGEFGSFSREKCAPPGAQTKQVDFFGNSACFAVGFFVLLQKI